VPPTFWTETSIQPFSCLLLILVCWSSSFRPKCPIGGGFFYFTPIRVVAPPFEKASFPFARSSLRRLLTSCAKQQNFHNEGTQPIYTRGCREIYLHHPTPLTGSVPKSGRLRDYDGKIEWLRVETVGDVAPSVPSCACETDVVLSWPEKLPPSEPACCLATKAGDIPSWEIPKNWQLMVI